MNLYSDNEYEAEIIHIHPFIDSFTHSWNESIKKTLIKTNTKKVKY